MNGARISAVVLCLTPLLCAGQAADDGYSLPPLESRNADELSQALSVFVERIEVRGVTAIAAEEIAALTAPYEGRNVTSADLQGDQPVEECRTHRHNDQEDHGRAMHCEQLVEDFRADQLALSLCKLGAHKQRFDAADQEPEERSDPV